ncbi:conserved hypothetical protein [Trichinella spiralis]|uniref:hypothetical protein n=1 Tax=Trichinella spiralis TaxID=6334 RepID=UPI0001EFEE6A|nr:conserved hypothetical protein [Trichinella spiralis]
MQFKQKKRVHGRYLSFVGFTVFLYVFVESHPRGRFIPRTRLPLPFAKKKSEQAVCLALSTGDGRIAFNQKLIIHICSRQSAACEKVFCSSLVLKQTGSSIEQEMDFL